MLGRVVWGGSGIIGGGHLQVRCGGGNSGSSSFNARERCRTEFFNWLRTGNFGTILDGIVAKEKVRCCQRSVRRRGSAVGVEKCEVVNVKVGEEEIDSGSKDCGLNIRPLEGKYEKDPWQSRFNVIPGFSLKLSSGKGDKFTVSTMTNDAILCLESAKISLKKEYTTIRKKDT